MEVSDIGWNIEQKAVRIQLKKKYEITYILLFKLYLTVFQQLPDKMTWHNLRYKKLQCRNRAWTNKQKIVSLKQRQLPICKFCSILPQRSKINYWELSRQFILLSYSSTRARIFCCPLGMYGRVKIIVMCQYCPGRVARQMHGPLLELLNLKVVPATPLSINVWSGDSLTFSSWKSCKLYTFHQRVLQIFKANFSAVKVI